MFTMSPSSTTVESGMPWQMTSLTRGAQRLGEAAVAERRRVRAVVEEELVADRVELVGGDARLDVLARRRASAWAARRAATRMRPIVSSSKHVRAGPTSGTRPADVLGAGDRRRDGRRGLTVPGTRALRGACTDDIPGSLRTGRASRPSVGARTEGERDG